LEGGELDLEKRKRYLQQSPVEVLNHAQGRLEKLVRLGIAGVRDAGDRDGVGLALAKQYNAPIRPVMPYLDSPGAAIHRRGRYGSFMGEPLEEFSSLRECVEARIRAGAYRIKIIATGVINFKEGRVTGQPQMTKEEIAEITSAARAAGRQTFAHASGGDGIELVIEGGVDSVEHGFFIRPDQLARMRDRGIGWVPTFAPVQAQLEHAEEMGWDANVVNNLRLILDQHGVSLMKAHRMGVQVLVGSDAGSYGVAHGFGLLHEMELMERIGMLPLAVINAATGNAAERLGLGERFGALRAGYKPRFVITKFNPVESVANLRKERWVVFDGKVYKTGEGSDGSGL
jgi:imidazolonepropionase-like amidohydrolase